MGGKPDRFAELYSVQNASALKNSRQREMTGGFGRNGRLWSSKTVRGY